MIRKVLEFVNKHKLLKANELYIVALSGGADSVALLLLLKNGGFNVHAAHCNFHLRGTESDRDEHFCVDLCERLGVTLHRVHFDTRSYAELHKVSIEMAARELRYRWFAQLCQDVGAAAVCVAHHRDDSVETVLMNLLRGTGLRGLTGIQPQMIREGDGAGRPELKVLRPLLGVSRTEIEAYLAELGQRYVTDSSNLKTDVLRNKVRLQLLPLLRELNPSVDENIQRTAENLSEAQMVLAAVVSSLKNNNILELSELSRYGSIEYFAYEWAKKYGFNGAQIRQLLDSKTGALVVSSTGYEALLDRGRIVVEPVEKAFRPMTVPEEGTYVSGDCRIQVKRLQVEKGAFVASKYPLVATIDAVKVRFPFTVRRVEEGDSMQPYGMKGRKLLSDLMTDRKMTVFEKRRQLVVVDGQGVIVWAVGLRVADHVAVSQATSEVLEFSVND